MNVIHYWSHGFEVNHNPLKFESNLMPKFESNLIPSLHINDSLFFQDF